MRGMARTDFFARYKSKIAVALVLTFVSGLVDVVGYVGIFHLFAAHVTGTTVHLGQGIVLGRRTDVIAASSIVAAFFLGGVIGRAIIQAGARRRFRNIASVTLGIEAAMIAFVAAGNVASARAGAALIPGMAHTYGYLAILAAAMGMQTATLTGIGPLTVHTTFVTGMVNKLAQLVSRILFRGYDFLRGHDDTAEKRTEQSVERKHAIFIFSIWVCYVLGAAGGTASFIRWGFRALFVGIAGLMVGIAADVARPLSVEEEREQSER
jgi:uncharacterized membrane protein YoaK (UPF0700 family)